MILARRWSARCSPQPASRYIDLGVDVPVAKLVEKAREVNADIIGVSALLTTTMVRQRDVVEALDDMGLRPKVKVMVGGAPVTREWVKEIGADGYSEDAIGAVQVAKQADGQSLGGSEWPRPIKSITNPKLSLDILTPAGSPAHPHRHPGCHRKRRGALPIQTRPGDLGGARRQQSIGRPRSSKPRALIEDALKKAPPAYTLAARDPSQDLPLDGNHVYLGTDGCGVEVIDIYSGERRRSRLQDVGEIARVADFLEEVAFHWVAVSAQDRPPEPAACTS